jgi:Ni,Fe-hydrogenase III component G
LDLPAPIPAEGQALAAGFLEVLYHFCHGAAMGTLRLTLPYSHPVILSICDLIPSAVIFERETIELFGVEIVDTPSREHLLLPDDWPDGVYPMRKSFTGTSPLSKDFEPMKGAL